jgi:hypothetical protein
MFKKCNNLFDYAITFFKVVENSRVRTIIFLKMDPQMAGGGPRICSHVTKSCTHHAKPFCMIKWLKIWYTESTRIPIALTIAENSSQYFIVHHTVYLVDGSNINNSWLNIQWEIFLHANSNINYVQVFFVVLQFLGKNIYSVRFPTFIKHFIYNFL